jgi:ferric-dicitrate binding protein FerR (iron transport regulator)
VVGPFKVRLSAGEIYVQVPKSRAGVFAVTTPVAEATARRADFFIKVAEPKMAVREQVVVTVQEGEVELANAQGLVRGSRGQSLRARAEERPVKEAAAPRKPPDAEPTKKKQP